MSVSDLVTEVEQALVEGERLDEERLQSGCEGMNISVCANYKG